jgi:hypothetical protein
MHKILIGARDHPQLALCLCDRLAAKYIRPKHAVFPRRTLFLGAAEAVEAGHYVYVIKTHVAQE